MLDAIDKLEIAGEELAQVIMKSMKRMKLVAFEIAVEKVLCQKFNLSVGFEYQKFPKSRK